MSPLTQYHVTTFLPNSDSLREAITSCVSGLTALGFEVTQADAQLLPHAVNVVLTSGADEALRHNISSIAHVIVYNWEQILPSVPWVNLDYFKLLKSHHVWDYSASNVAALKAAGICNIHHLKMAYAPQMTRFESQAEPDIDVLFYGNINPRRQAVIDAIRAKGLHVVTSNDVEGGLHGAVRDQYLARAKMVLNLHGQDESKAFEIARVSYLLANKKAVVSEINAGNDIDDDLRRAIIGAPLEQIPQLCADLAAQPDECTKIGQRGFEAFVARDAVALMQGAVDAYWQQNQHAPTTLPKTIKIITARERAENAWQFNCLNIDSSKTLISDWVLDLSCANILDSTTTSWRFTNAQLQANYFESIIAHDVFHRVEDLSNALRNCLTLLQDGGVLALSVPLELSYEMWAHVDDRRAFNENTWTRILDDWWALGWGDYRFELASVGYGLNSNYGMAQLQALDGDWAAALKKPRVIDRQNITLRKRAITDDERRQLPQHRFMD